MIILNDYEGLAMIVALPVIALFGILFFLYKITEMFFDNFNEDEDDDYINYDDCNHLNMYYKKTRGKNR